MLFNIYDLIRIIFLSHTVTGKTILDNTPFGEVKFKSISFFDWVFVMFKPIPGLRQWGFVQVGMSRKYLIKIVSCLGFWKQDGNWHYWLTYG